MTSKKMIHHYSCHRLFLMALSIIFLMAAGGIMGCSDSSSGGSGTYHLTGYDGVPETESASSATLMGAGNSGLKFFSQAPWYVNLTFQVTDQDGAGISELKTTDFKIHENDVLLDPTTANINIRKRDLLPPEYTYQLKTVLLIDNSSSVSPEMLNKIMEGAKAFWDPDNPDIIDEMEQQEFAIVAFDNDGAPELISDFTTNTSLLNQYLTPGNPRAIQRSYGTANLYGTVIYALSLWDENPSPASKTLTQGFVVAITQGKDTAGLYNINDAVATRDYDNKRVVTVPVGSGIPAGILADMETLGNGWYYPVPKTDKTQIPDQITIIQERILTFADSFYWIQYRSEQVGAPGARRDHIVDLAVAGNINKNENASITGTFSSKEFIAGEGVYFNASTSDPSGVKEITYMLERGQAIGSVTDELSALTYSRTGKVPSKFIWTSLDSNVVTVDPKPGNSPEAVVTANNVGETTIQVTDTANGVSANLKVTVLLREFSFEILRHMIESEGPWNVDATFQVRETDPSDNQWEWISDMKREEFTLLENKGTAFEELVDRETSEINLRKRNRLPSTHTYTLKTVLLIDNSPSTDADGDNLALMKEAAKAFVHRAYTNELDDPNYNKGPILDAAGRNQQEIAIWSFTELGDSRIVQDFTNDIATLEAAIDAIPRGFGPINFYGGMVDALRLWQNNQAPRTGGSQLRQGVLLVLTDGWDSLSGFVNKGAVLGEIKDNKQVLCVGVADDLVTRANLNDLKAFANAGYYSVPDPDTDLVNTLRQIQDEIVDFADSFYWLHYKSSIFPAQTCANKSTLHISIKDNSNPDQQNISGAFETCDFFDGIAGTVYVNSTATNPWGEDTIDMSFISTDQPLFTNWAIYQAKTLEAVTYKAAGAPNYAWSSSNSNVVIVDADTTVYANSRAFLRLPANPRAGTAEIQVTDRGNNSVMSITVRVERVDVPMPAAYYPFNGDATDATGNGRDGEVFGPRLTIDRFGNPNSAYSIVNSTLTKSTNYIALNMFYGPTDGSNAWAGETINELTVGAWVKSSSDKIQHIVSFDRSQYWHLTLKNSKEQANAEWAVTNSAGSTVSLVPERDYADGQWQFIVATYDSTVSKLYVNGQEVTSRAVNGPIGTGLASWGFIGVGSYAREYDGVKIYPHIWAYGADNTFFSGDIDDVMIFHRALTPAQVSMLYQSSK
jgi:hypothetical protein